MIEPFESIQVSSETEISQRVREERAEQRQREIQSVTDEDGEENKVV